MKTFLKIVLSFGCMLLLAAAIFSGLIYFNQDKLFNRFLHEANKSLKTPVRIAEIRLAAWQNFPLLSIVASGVEVEDSFPEQSPLMKAEKVSFLLNAFDFWRGNYVIRQLRIDNAEFHVKVDERGEDNYEIFRPKQEEVNKPESVSFNLSDIRLSNVSAEYLSVNGTPIDAALFTQELRLDIVRHAQGFDIGLRGGLQSDRLVVGNDTLLTDKSIETHLGLHYFNDAHELVIEASDLAIDGSAFQLAGSIGFAHSTPYFNLQLGNRATTWASLLSLLSKKISTKLLPYQGSGQMYFKAQMKGPGERAAVMAKFGFRDASFKHEKSGVKIVQANLEGTVEMPAMNRPAAAKLSLRNVTGIFDGQPFTANLALTNFEHPVVDFSFEGQLNMANTVAFLNQQGTLLQASGMLSAKMRLQGDFEKLKNRATARQVKAEGVIGLQHIGFIYSKAGIPIKELNGVLHFNNNDLALENVRAFVGKSDFVVHGFFRNIITYISFAHEPLAIDATLRSKLLDLDDLSPALFHGHHGEESLQFSIPNDLELNFKTDIEFLKYQRFKGRHIKGILAIKDQLAVTQRLSFQSLGGDLYLNGFIDAKNPNAIQMDISLSTANVDVDSVFYLFNNFGQDFVQQRHLKGKLTANANILLTANNRLIPMPASIVGGISCAVRGGELNNFEPLQKLNRFIDDEELNHLRFADLKNEIFIEKSVVHIPQMEIKSNVSTLLLSGTHTFDQHIDYHIAVPLRRKSKVDPDEAFGAIEKDNLGQTKLFLKITGTTDDYLIGLDKAAVKKKISESLKKEAQEFKDAFKNKPQLKKEIELQEDDYFEWDSNDAKTKE